MNFYEWLSGGSADHSAKILNDGIQLSAVDNSQGALERFQPLAQDVIARNGEGYTVTHTHTSAQVPGDLYDTLVLVQIRTAPS
jgi:hypothetical protein